MRNRWCKYKKLLTHELIYASPLLSTNKIGPQNATKRGMMTTKHLIIVPFLAWSILLHHHSICMSKTRYWHMSSLLTQIGWKPDLIIIPCKKTPLNTIICLTHIQFQSHIINVILSLGYESMKKLMCYKNIIKDQTSCNKSTLVLTCYITNDTSLQLLNTKHCKN